MLMSVFTLSLVSFSGFAADFSDTPAGTTTLKDELYRYRAAVIFQNEYAALSALVLDAKEDVEVPEKDCNEKDPASIEELCFPEPEIPNFCPKSLPDLAPWSVEVDKQAGTVDIKIINLGGSFEKTFSKMKVFTNTGQVAEVVMHKAQEAHGLSLDCMEHYIQRVSIEIPAEATVLGIVLDSENSLQEKNEGNNEISLNI